MSFVVVLLNIMKRSISALSKSPPVTFSIHYLLLEANGNNVAIICVMNTACGPGALSHPLPSELVSILSFHARGLMVEAEGTHSHFFLVGKKKKEWGIHREASRGCEADGEFQAFPMGLRSLAGKPGLALFVV